MQIDDRLTIWTPEGVDLELTLAGIGSRFVATLLDLLIRGALLLAVGLLLLAGVGGGVASAVFIVWVFLVFFAYDIVFEVLASGRTLGKRWTGLRVVLVGGAPVGLLASAVRNVLRLVDILPGAYLVGAIAILVSRRNQRLGDLAAGTLVVRERRAVSAVAPLGTGLAPPQLAGWDVSGITAEEVAAVRSFLSRRDGLEPASRNALARALAERLRPKVAGGSELRGDETFLEHLAAVKASRS